MSEYRSRNQPHTPRSLLAAILLTVTALVHGQGLDLGLPDIGDPSGSLFTPAQEQRLGQAFMRSVHKSMKVEKDPLLTAYIQSLGSRLIQSSPHVTGSFHFFLVDDPQINAFAGPAGNIGTYTGLIATTETESELASVLAHEIAHVTQNHLARTFDSVNRLNMPTAAMILAAVVVGAATNNPEAGLFVAQGAQAAQIQHQINFTRSNEQEADSVGIAILSGADFDPSAMAVFFDRMGKATRLYRSGKLPEFLSTHPVTTDRIADAFGRAEDHPYRQRPESLEYHLVKAILKLRQIENPRQAVDYFASSLREKRYRNREAQQYGHALALIEERRYAEARPVLEALLGARPEQIHYIVAHARLLALDGEGAAGIEQLRRAMRLYPGNYPLTLYLADALLEAGAAGEALALLEQQLPVYPGETQMHARLARAAGETGDKALGHQYLAEYHYYSGDLEPAIQQLEIALRDRQLPYHQSARLTARLKQFKQEREELKSREQK
ncbi:MAG: hypothetical protein B0D96_03970 [Candidatus Sedimenticola endophacoides]|nr:MAG: hypothetical protein B0D94_03685 [Candidatus Sedimenticola endophacoides]OQX36535.1 MAG: hypothetical protein B0D96_03970 [Candidatus Sedimenticola endophacoides]OQX41534.1 MAG: hypothetical protein B0D89_03770 [Candidatus Sedimenticola endophacoides]OQX48761.1 MAG: hypothetical protein B0D87_04025 [Candidatus Sedimenticola endophacoides]